MKGGDAEAGAEPAPAPTAPPEAHAHTVGKNTTAILVGRVTGQLFRVAATLLAAAYLGTEGWGLFGYLVSSLELFRTFTNFGLDTAAVRAFAIGRFEPPSIVANLLRLKVWTSLALGLALVGGTYVVDDLAPHRALCVVLAFALMPQGIALSLAARLHATHQASRLIPVQAVTGALYLGGVGAIAQLRLGIGAFVCLYVANEVAIAATTYLAYRKAFGPLHLADTMTNCPLIGSLYKRAVYVGIVEVLVIVYSRLGVFFVDEHGGLSAVGRYYTAMKISEPLLIVFGALSVSAYPVLSKAFAANAIADVKASFVRYSLGAFVVTSAMSVLVWFVAEDLLALIKPEYAGAGGALVALTCAMIFASQNQLSSAVVNAAGRFSWIAAIAAMNLVVYAGAASFLVPRYGVTGAGLSTLLMEGINALVQIALVIYLLNDRMKTPRAEP